MVSNPGQTDKWVQFFFFQWFTLNFPRILQFGRSGTRPFFLRVPPKPLDGWWLVYYFNE